MKWYLKLKEIIFRESSIEGKRKKERNYIKD